MTDIFKPIKQVYVILAKPMLIDALLNSFSIKHTCLSKSCNVVHCRVCEKLHQSTFLNSPTHFPCHFETWVYLPANSYKSTTFFTSKFIRHYIKRYCKLIRMKRNKSLNDINYFNFLDESSYHGYSLLFIHKLGTRKYGRICNITNF
jgi:hypothetical protein